MKTHWKKLTNPDYIGAYAFQPGERKIVTIKTAMQKTVKNAQGSDDCLVVSFAENEKPLICNVTNAKSISKVAGSSFIEEWIGTKIELFVAQVSAFGDTVEAVRVKSTAPVIQKPTITDAQKKAAADKGVDRALVEKHYSITDQDWADIESLKINNESNEG